MEKINTLEDLLRKALQKLKKEEFYDEYYRVLLSAWYTTIAELKLALSDGAAWTDIQLPGRLKLEMKRMIISMEQKEIVDENQIPPSSSSVNIDNNSPSGEISWIRCFSTEHNAYYYYHKTAGTTQWDLPSDEAYDDDPSVSNLHVQGRNKEVALNDSVSGDNDLLLLAQGTLDDSGEYLSPMAQQHQQHFIVTNHDRGLSPLDDQFYSPTATAVSAIPVPSCPPFTVVANLCEDDNDNGHYGSAEYDDDYSDESLSEEEKAGERTGSTRRKSPTGLLRSATKGVLNALGARSRNSGNINVDTDTMVDSNHDADHVDDEDYDEHVRLLCEMGFTVEQASDALVENNNDVTAAASYLVNNSNIRELVEAQQRVDGDNITDASNSNNSCSSTSGNTNLPPPPPPLQPPSSSSGIVAETGLGTAKRGNPKSPGGVTPLFSKGLNLFGKPKQEQQVDGVAARSGISVGDSGSDGRSVHK